MTDIDRLKILRNQIDEVDGDIVHALDERFAICQEINKIKKRLNMNVYDSNNEQEMIKQLSNLEIHQGLVEFIWPTIMEYSHNL